VARRSIKLILPSPELISKDLHLCFFLIFFELCHIDCCSLLDTQIRTRYSSFEIGIASCVTAQTLTSEAAQINSSTLLNWLTPQDVSIFDALRKGLVS